MLVYKEKVRVEMMSEMKKGSTIQSLQVGLSIVDLIAKHSQSMTLTEIHEATKITKSNLYKYLYTLTHLGMLYRDESSGTYALGGKLVEYGMAAVNREDIVDRVTPVMQRMNLECKETVLLVLWANDGPVVARILNSQNVLNIGAQIGTYLPLLSASGKVFAAFKDDPQAAVWKDKEWVESEDDANRLVQELDEVRQQKIAFANEPLVPFVSSVAIPILNYKQQLLGAVTMVGFSNTIPQDTDHATSRYLLEKGREVSRTFGAF